MFSPFSNNGYQRFPKWSVIDPNVNGYFGYAGGMSGDGQFVIASRQTPRNFFCYNGWTGATRYTFTTPTTCDYDLAGVSPNGKYAALADSTYDGGNGRVYIFNLNDGSLKRTIEAYNPENLADVNFAFSANFSFSYDGSILAIGAPSYRKKTASQPTAGEDVGAVHLYNVETGTRLTTIYPPYFNYNGSDNAGFFGLIVTLSYDGTRLVTTNPFKGASFDGQAYLYDATTFSLLQTYNPPNPIGVNVYGFVQNISADKNKIYFGDAQQTVSGTANAGVIRVCSATTGALLQTFNNPLVGSGVTLFGSFVQPTADGTKLITTGIIGTQRIWLSVDAETGLNPRFLVIQEQENIGSQQYGFIAKADLFGTRLLLTNPFLKTPYLDQGGVYVYNITGQT